MREKILIPIEEIMLHQVEKSARKEFLENYDGSKQFCWGPVTCTPIDPNDLEGGLKLRYRATNLAHCLIGNKNNLRAWKITYPLETAEGYIEQSEIVIGSAAQAIEAIPYGLVNSVIEQY